MMTMPNFSVLLAAPMVLHIVKLLAALFLTVIAFLLAKGLQVLTVKLLEAIKYEVLADKIGLKSVLKKADIKLSPTELKGVAVFWTVLLGAGLAIIYYMQFTRAYGILRTMFYYVFINVVSAMFILCVAVLLASLLSGMILFIGELINLPGYRLIARVNQYVVVIFGIVFGLDRLGISTVAFLAKPDIILGFFALAGAIAFGLGCKDIAENFLVNFLRNK